MKRNVFITVLLCFMVTVISCSGKKDITGIWKGKYTGTDRSNSGTIETGNDIELMLAQTDKNIAGKITIGDKSLGKTLDYTIRTGVIVDKALSIEADMMKIDGTVNGNSIEGKLDTQYGGMLIERHYVNGSFVVKKQ